MTIVEHSYRGGPSGVEAVRPTDARAQYLESATCALFSVYHPPRGRELKTAVLICAPFGWEEVCSYRSRRRLAEVMSDAGHPALRIDLPGTGDSTASDRHDSKLELWTDAMRASGVWLGEHSRAPAVAAIGIGFGGVIACQAIATGSAFEELVLWNVPAGGRTFVRELRAFARLEQNEVAAADAQAALNAQEPALEAGGFGLDADTVRDLERLDLEQLPRELAVERALLLGRDTLGADGRLHSLLVARAVDVTEVAGAGYGAMTAEPQLARAPLDTFTLIREWLERRPPPPESRREPAPRERSRGDGRAAAVVACEMAGAAGRIRERPVAVEQSFGNLFGILATPLDAELEPLAAVLLNAGAIRRIGPNRMWVEIARRWASRGVATLRLDLEGIGDSDGDGERFHDLAELYAGEMAGQVRAALDAIEAETGVRRFVLGGLCSGAYWSFHTALQDERVSAALMLNPQTLFWDPVVAEGRDLRKALLQGSSWTRLLSGRASRRRMWELARELPAGARGFARRLGGKLPLPARGPEGELDVALRALHEQGKRALVAFSGQEPLYEEMRRDGRLERLRSWPNVELETLSGNDHTLRPLQARADAGRVLDRALARELALLDEAAPGHARAGG